MGAPTGDFSVDWSGVATANPYTPPNFTLVDTAQAVQAVNGSGIKPTAIGPAQRWYYNGLMQASPTSINAKVEIGAYDSHDWLYALVIDSAGRGYALQINSGTVLLTMISGAPDSVTTTVLKSTTLAALNVGDVLELDYTPGTGAMTCLQNGTAISGLSTTDTTYTPTTFGFGFNPQNINQTYALGFAGDGTQIIPPNLQKSYASVIVTAPINTGSNSIFDANYPWSSGTPTPGMEVLYIASDIAIQSDGTIIGVVPWMNGTTTVQAAIMPPGGGASGIPTWTWRTFTARSP